MNAIAVEPLVSVLRERITDPERQRIAIQIAIELGDLHARKLLGQDIEREIAHVKAQAAMLAATEAEAVRQAIEGWWAHARAAVLDIALAAL